MVYCYFNHFGDVKVRGWGGRWSIMVRMYCCSESSWAKTWRSSSDAAIHDVCSHVWQPLQQMHACENVQFCSRARLLVNWKGAVELWVKCVNLPYVCDCMSTSTLRSLPQRRPNAACGKLRNSCGHVIWPVDQSPSFLIFHSSFCLPQFRILPIAVMRGSGVNCASPSPPARPNFDISVCWVWLGAVNWVKYGVCRCYQRTFHSYCTVQSALFPVADWIVLVMVLSWACPCRDQQFGMWHTTAAVSLKRNLLPSVLWRCWLGGRKGIRPKINLMDGVLAWLSV